MIEDILTIKEEDVIKYIKEHGLDFKGRGKRVLEDPRNFCINILYYGFEWTEQRISKIINKDRSSVNHSKDMAYILKEEPMYLKHTKHVRNHFLEWTAPKPYRRHTKANRKRAITVFFDEKEYKKLQEYRDIIGCTTITHAVKKLVFHKLDKL